MSIATVVTEGFGSFGTIGHVVRDGFDGNTVAPPTPPPVTPDPVRGGKGDNRKKLHLPFKPTGLVDRPRKERKSVDERVDDSREIQAEVARELASQLRGEIESDVVRMTQAQIDAEIGVLLRKRIRTEEDEVLLLLLIAAAG